MDAPIDSEAPFCQRCKRPAPPTTDHESLHWEALVSEGGEYLGVICPGCITGQEEQARDADAMETIAEIEAEDRALKEARKWST
jgi:hypothetical protein